MLGLGYDIPAFHTWLQMNPSLKSTAVTEGYERKKKSDGNINSFRVGHPSILQRHAPPADLHLCRQGFTLPSKHISELCRNYLKTKEDWEVQTVVDFLPPSMTSTQLNSCLKSEKVKLSCHHKKLFGTWSNHSGMTSAIRFDKNLGSHASKKPKNNPFLCLSSLELLI